MIQQSHSWAYIQTKLLKKYTCTHMLIAALFTSQDMETTQMSINDDWIRKMWYIYTMDYYSAIKKKNKVMPFAATWMELETLILSEMSQKEKDKYHMISLISGI